MDISEYQNFPLNPEWQYAETYELREYNGGDIKQFSREDILSARDKVLAELIKEDIEQFKPELYLVVVGEQTNLAIHAIIDDESKAYDGNESRNRIFHIQDNKIILITKGRPKGSPKSAE